MELKSVILTKGFNRLKWNGIKVGDNISFYFQEHNVVYDNLVTKIERKEDILEFHLTVLFKKSKLSNITIVIQDGVEGIYWKDDETLSKQDMLSSLSGKPPWIEYYISDFVAKVQSSPLDANELSLLELKLIDRVLKEGEEKRVLIGTLKERMENASDETKETIRALPFTFTV